jgi:hypothetical protein
MLPNNGVSYEEPIARLNAAFPSPAKGEKILHKDLKKVIQADERRYYGVLRAWCKNLENRGMGLVPRVRRGVGIVFLTGLEHAERQDKKRVLTVRNLKRTAKETNGIDTSDMDEAQKATQNLRRRIEDEIARSADKANNEMKPAPPTVGADNVRLFKPSA